MKISIVTVNYNNSEGLKRTIESVISQDVFNQIEYIIIDGGSNDSSYELIKHHKSHLAYWCSETDNGIYNAMNKGIEHASGDYVLFLNSGDFLYDKETIKNVLPELESGECFIMGREMLYPDNKLLYDDIYYPLKAMDFFNGSPVPHNACFIKQSVFKNLKYDEKYRIVSDLKFFLEGIVFQGLSHKIITNVITYFEKGGISSDRERCRPEQEAVLKELFPKSILDDYMMFRHFKLTSLTNYNLFFDELWNRSPRFARFIFRWVVGFSKILSYKYTSLSFSKKYNGKESSKDVETL